MQQSIPAVPTPTPPPGNRGAFAHVVSPGGGTFAILSWSRGLGISIPQGDPPSIWHTCFHYIGEDETFVKDWLVHQDLSTLLKVCFLNLRYFSITWKHINISDKVNYILFITKQSLTWTLREHYYFACRVKI